MTNDDIRRVLNRAAKIILSGTGPDDPKKGTAYIPEAIDGWHRLAGIEFGKTWDSTIITWEEAARMLSEYRRVRNALIEVGRIVQNDAVNEIVDNVTRTTRRPPHAGEVSGHGK